MGAIEDVREISKGVDALHEQVAQLRKERDELRGAIESAIRSIDGITLDPKTFAGQAGIALPMIRGALRSATGGFGEAREWSALVVERTRERDEARAEAQATAETERARIAESIRRVAERFCGATGLALDWAAESIVANDFTFGCAAMPEKDRSETVASAERSKIVAMLEADAASLKADRDDEDLRSFQWWEGNAQLFATLRAKDRVERLDHHRDGGGE